MTKVALVLGSFKPVHSGHWRLIEIAASECDEVLLFVSTSDRRRKGEIPILGTDMQNIWTQYLEPELPGNITVEYDSVSPVVKMYEKLEKANAENDKKTIYVIYSDNEDILKYTNKNLKKSVPKLLNNKQIERRRINRAITVPVSGTKMRSYIANGNVKMFISLLPPPAQKNGKKIYDLLKNHSMEESVLQHYVKEILLSSF